MPLASSLLGEGFRLPISRRGLFSKDDFFSSFQDDYRNAVEDVLGRWRSRSSLADRFASYKKLRERDTSDDSQAATISDSPDNYVIVLDMGKYSSGQITVETQGYAVLVKGKAGELSCERLFPLPKDTNIDRVVADLSDEGILSVSAPRTERGAKGGVTSPATSEKNGNISNTTSSAAEERVIPTTRQGVTPTSTSAAATASTQRAQEIRSSSVSSSSRKGSSSRIIPLTIEDDTSSDGNVNTTSSSSNKSSQVSSDTTTGHFERVIPTIREGDDVSGNSQRKGSVQYPLSTSASRVLPIHRRGRFFQDSTFEGVWNDFEHAVDDLVAKKSGESQVKEEEKEKKEDDDFQSYRNLRKVIKEEDNQAATITKEGNGYKIVMDVKDFADGLLDVKALEGSVVVTGEKGSNNFERRFSIPGLSEPEKVGAALSADGILTITAPF